MSVQDICIAPGCERQVGRSGAKGKCFMHYMRRKTYTPITHLDAVSDFDKGWFIGLFEGEGSISDQGAYTVQISLTMTDLDLIEHAQAIIKLGSLLGPYPAPRSDKQMWTLKVCKTVEALALLEWMLPHLGGRRRERASDALKRLKRGRNYRIMCEGVT